LKIHLKADKKKRKSGLEKPHDGVFNHATPSLTTWCWCTFWCWRPKKLQVALV